VEIDLHSALVFQVVIVKTGKAVHSRIPNTLKHCRCLLFNILLCTMRKTFEVSDIVSSSQKLPTEQPTATDFAWMASLLSKLVPPLFISPYMSPNDPKYCINGDIQS